MDLSVLAKNAYDVINVFQPCILPIYASMLIFISLLFFGLGLFHNLFICEIVLDSAG